MPADMGDILGSIADILTNLEWEAGGKVFADVSAIPNLPSPAALYDTIRNLPAAIVIDGGQAFEDQSVPICNSFVSVGIIVNIPQDHRHEYSLLGAKGIYAIVAAVQAELLTTDGVAAGAPIEYLASSGNMPITDTNSPGGPVLKEIRYKVKHEDF